MAAQKELKLPAQVLAQAKAAVAPVPKRSAPVPRGRKNPTREKVIAALKKLHPMD
jgi:hypothetical protein